MSFQKCLKCKNPPISYKQGTYRDYRTCCCYSCAAAPVPPMALDEGVPRCLSSAWAGLLRRVVSASASAVPLTWSHLINSFAVGCLSISQAAVSISAVGEETLLPKVRVCAESLLRFGCLSLKPQLLELSLQENRLEGEKKSFLLSRW